MKNHYFILLIFYSFAGFAQLPVLTTSKSIDNSFLIENITKEICSIKKDKLILNENADNTFVLSLFEHPFSKSLNFKQDSKNLIDKIFTKDNYKYIKSQVEISKWTSEINSIIPCEVTLMKKKDINAHQKPNLYIAKPVYTRDNKFALVSYVYKNMHSLVIFRKENNKWQKAEFIPLGLS